MCGIVGYTGKQHAAPLIIEGLKRLEYRGYDSAGVAVTTPVTGGEPGQPGTAKPGALVADCATAPVAAALHCLKRIGRVSELELAAAQPEGALPAFAHCGIGHTRWATHGGVTQANAHPHLSNDGRIALVHNGVIENFHSIKKFLLGHGYTFSSETDTEVLCNLIAYHYAKEPPKNAASEDNDTQDARLLVAVRGALRHVEGTYGLVALCVDAPDELVAARKGSPLILGLGEGEHLVASDAAALISRTQKVVYLNDGELAHLSPTELRLSSLNAAPLEPVVDQITWSIAQAELGDYAHFMQKEIFEQPDALENTMRGRFAEDGSTAQFGGLNLSADELRNIDRIILCACGTAWHACLVTKHLIERFARLPVEVDYASEFRYRNAPISPRTLCLVMSQSGETIDTLAALREAKRKGLRVLAVTNVVGSTIAREADGGIYQHAGPEIGVASTKAFTSQLLIGAMLALYLARLRTMSFTDGADAVAALRAVPALIRQTLEQAPRITEIATRYAQAADMLFLGRLALFPIALEGALKLKEISYIHAEGYPAAELKHGPIALISPDCPSVFFVTRGELFSKVVSSMQEVKARGGPIIAICTEGLELPENLADARIDIPDCHEAVLPLVATIPVQLLSYEIAKQRGCDVDKPRNLAKSVTVE